MNNQAQQIIEATMEFALRPRREDRAKVIAAAFKELINQFGYDNYHVDGDHGLCVVNVRDILNLIEELEKTNVNY